MDWAVARWLRDKRPNDPAPMIMQPQLAREHHNKLHDPDGEWWLRHNDRSREFADGPYSYYNENTLGKQHFQAQCVGPDHSRRVFKELARLGHSFSEENVQAWKEDSHVRQSMATRYREVMGGPERSLSPSRHRSDGEETDGEEKEPHEDQVAARRRRTEARRAASAAALAVVATASAAAADEAPVRRRVTFQESPDRPTKLRNPLARQLPRPAPQSQKPPLSEQLRQALLEVHLNPPQHSSSMLPKTNESQHHAEASGQPSLAASKSERVALPKAELRITATGKPIVVLPNIRLQLPPEPADIHMPFPKIKPRPQPPMTCDYQNSLVMR